MIQDIKPRRFSVEYKPWQPEEKDLVLLFHRGNVILTDEGSYPTRKQADAILTDPVWQFLFKIDKDRYFTILDGSVSEDPLPVGLTELPTNNLRRLSPMHLVLAGYTGWHLWSWYRNNRYCGRCGHKMDPGTDERKMVCPHCRSLVYPRINPCIIVAVHDGERLLMTRYANRPVTWFVLIAGFIEIGETCGDTVRREVMEEAGVHVKNIRYFGSQPWGIPGNLTLGFTAELDGDDSITIDDHELSAGRWFPRSEVPVPDDDVSITAAMIRAFAEGKI